MTMTDDEKITVEKHIKRSKYWYHVMRSEMDEAAVLRQELLDDYDFDVTSFMEEHQPHSVRVIFDYNFKLLVCKGKHEDYYYDITEPNNAAGVFLTILKNNLDFYDNEPEFEKDEIINQLHLFQEQPKSDLQQAREILELAKDKSKFLWAGWHAFKFLDLRKHYEYEGIEIEYFGKIDEDFYI